MYLLWVNQTRACQDDKDRVYSVLGNIIDVLESDVRPDYTKTVQELYTEITVKISRKSSSLVVLSYVDSEHLPGAPSWVPKVSISLVSFSVSSSVAGNNFCVHSATFRIAL